MKLLLTKIVVALPVLGLLYFIYFHNKVKFAQIMAYLMANAFESYGDYKDCMIAGFGRKTDGLAISQSEDSINGIGSFFSNA